MQCGWHGKINWGKDCSPIIGEVISTKQRRMPICHDFTGLLAPKLHGFIRRYRENEHNFSGNGYNTNGISNLVHLDLECRNRKVFGDKTNPTTFCHPPNLSSTGFEIPDLSGLPQIPPPRFRQPLGISPEKPTNDRTGGNCHLASPGQFGYSFRVRSVRKQGFLNVLRRLGGDAGDSR